MMTTDSERRYKQSSSRPPYFPDKAAVEDHRPLEGYYMTQAERRFQELNNMESIHDNDELFVRHEDALCHQETAQRLRGDLSRLQRLLFAFLGLAMMSFILNFGSFMAGRKLLAEKDSYMMTTTTATGGRQRGPMILELEVRMPSSQEEGPFPYACNVALEDAANMWRSVMQGQPTNVLLVHSKQEDMTMQQQSMVGVSLSFQGATLNNTHACLTTLSKEHKHALCIDFVTPRCAETGDDTDDFGSDTSKEQDGDRRNELFHQSVVQQNAEINPEDKADCELGIFCGHHFASIVLVGHTGY